MKYLIYLIYLYTSVLVLPTEIKDVRAEGGMFSRDATGTAGEVLLMWEKGYWRKIIGTFLLAYLLKSVEDG